MTDTSIRAELRKAAMTEDPWANSVGLLTAIAWDFARRDEYIWKLSPDECRWFFLLVAEAL